MSTGLAIPSNPNVGVLNGKVSWFGGPHDPTDSGHTASGGSTAEPGIAVYNRATLGGYWRVQFPNGRSVVLKQTDLGPNPYTGRSVDVTYSALGQAGYNEGNFPTDGRVTATFLGHNAHQGGQMAQGSATSTPSRVGGQDTTGAIMDSLLSTKNIVSSNPSSTAVGGGDLLNNVIQRLQSGAYNVPGSHPSNTPVSNYLGGGTAQPSLHGNHFLPAGALYKPGRADQGRDGQTNPGGALIAPGAGVVVRVGSDPRGFGPDYPIVHFTSGPYAGKTLYLGHTHAALQAGAHFQAGQTLSHTGYGVGNATVPGWYEIGFAPGGSPGPMGQPTPF